MSKYKCDTCIYRAKQEVPWKCEFITIMGHRRACEPGNLCIEYKKGARIKIPNSNQSSEFLGLYF